MSLITISVTGTESTGKTTLSEQLAGRYKCSYVPDVSRSYIAALKKPYTYQDVLNIADGIIDAEDKAMRNADKILISDNDLINIKIWLQYYKWQVPTWLSHAIEARKYDIYLLCNIDLPWEADEQRNNQNDRELLYKQFTSELNALQAKYFIVSGNSTQRFQNATSQLDFILRK